MSNKLQHLWEWQSAIDTKDKEFIPHESLVSVDIVYITRMSILDDEPLDTGVPVRLITVNAPSGEPSLVEFTPYANNEEYNFHAYWAEVFPANMELLGRV